MLTPTPTEPQKARFTKDHAMVKDRYYYNGTEFSWNKPATITEKFYPYFHKQKDENKGKIQELQNQEKKDKAFMEQMRREQIIGMKQDTKARYEQRVKERSLIQNKSQQPIKSLNYLDTQDYEDEALDIIAKRMGASKHLRSNEISWNHLHRASKKFVDQYVRPVSVKRENEMMQHYKKKLEEEQKREDDKNFYLAENRRAIRQSFLNRHEENFEKEKQAGLIPGYASLGLSNSKSAKENLPSINVLDTDPSRRESSKLLVTTHLIPTLQTTEGEFKVKYASSIPNLDAMRERSLKTPSIDSLSRPRLGPKKECDLEHAELKGMLIKNMDDKVYYSDNVFYQTIASQSKFFQDTLTHNRDERKKLASRTTTRNDRPVTSGSEDPSICRFRTRIMSCKSGASSQQSLKPLSTKRPTELTERDEVYNDLDLFEKRMPIAKSSGCGRAELQETFKTQPNYYK